MAPFDGDALDDARRIIARYPEPHGRSAIMPLLYLAQSIDGMVTLEALREIGGLLGITTAEVEAVATFYSMYRLRPTGEHVVNVCTNLACKLRGPARSTRPRTRRAACRTAPSAPTTACSRCMKRSAWACAITRRRCRSTSATTTTSRPSGCAS